MLGQTPTGESKHGRLTEATADAVVISTLSVAGYRSLREVRLVLGRLTVVTGPNESGKSSLYRSLRLLAECAQGG